MAVSVLAPQSPATTPAELSAYLAAAPAATEHYRILGLGHSGPPIGTIPQQCLILFFGI